MERLFVFSKRNLNFESLILGLNYCMRLFSFITSRYKPIIVLVLIKSAIGKENSLQLIHTHTHMHAREKHKMKSLMLY